MQQVTAVDEEPLPIQPRVGKRAYALDALRGIAILAMVLSALIPYGRTPHGMLPSWMYHAQNPPPEHAFLPDLPGITWVDLVFPFFLFTMGAAIPLALARRIERGTPLPKMLGGIAWRGALLVAFALYREHVAPYGMSGSPGTQEWLTALGAMALVFMVWGRFPEDWKLWQRNAWHAVGWLCAIVLLISIHYPDGGDLGPSVRAMRQWVEHADIIILVLANVSVFGSLLWLATRTSWWGRLALTGLMMALKISASAPGWTQDLWNATPARWLYRMEFLKYLMIVLPATIVGDMLLAWMRGAFAPGPGEISDGDEATARPAPWPRVRYALLGVLCVALSAVVTVGMTGRYVHATGEQVGRAVLETTLLTFAVVAAVGALVSRPTTELEAFLRRLYQWAAWWLVFGLIFEPYEGGIQKGRPTISYFFVTLGLSIFMLMAFIVLIDAFQKRRAVQLLIDTGQNPLLAYIGHSNFIMPLWVMAGLNAWLSARLVTPWQGALHGALLTLLLALFVSGLTRLKVFVRA